MVEKTEKVPVKKEEGRGGLLERGWDPFGQLRTEMDRLFDDFTSGWPWSPSRRGRKGAMEPFRGMMDPFRGAPFAAWGTAAPAVDVVDKETAIEVHAELPGMDEGDIDVKISGGLLTIHGEKKEEKEEGEAEGSYYVSERRYGSFQRSFRIPDGIDLDKVDATFKKGVLIVTLPKTPEAQEKVKTIKVKGEKEH
jgi:HSP20 family protein